MPENEMLITVRIEGKDLDSCFVWNRWSHVSIQA